MMAGYEFYHRKGNTVMNAQAIRKYPETMTSRERVNATLRFEKTDRVTIGYESNPAIHVRLWIAVLNFANAFEPGGGVKLGCSAQEESLCRCSTLYPALAATTKYYDWHNTHFTDKASDSLIYTENVTICKTDTEFPERMPEEKWVTVDVVTMAAPDLRTELMDMPNAELYSTHVSRATHMLSVAAEHEVDILVLGAFGCGAFRNNPIIVAAAWNDALKWFWKTFDRVIFAIYGNEVNYRVFRK